MHLKSGPIWEVTFGERGLISKVWRYQRRKSEALNRKRTDNTMVKRKRTDNTIVKRKRTDNTIVKRKRTDNTMVKRKRTDNTMVKRKRTVNTMVKRRNNHLQKIAHKTKDWVTRTPLKTVDEFKCSRRELIFW